VAFAAAAGCRAPEPAPAASESGEWVVTESGAGPVKVGMTAAEIAAHVERLGALEECTYATARAAPGLLVMLVDGSVARLDVIDRSIATAAGARVGDSEARIQELYRPRVRVEPHKYTDGHYLVVDAAPERRLVFETDGAQVTRYRAGAVPQVDWVEGCS
jgi:hypothetical protein